MKSYSKEEQVCQNKDMECSYKYTHDQKLYITAKSSPPEKNQNITAKWYPQGLLPNTKDYLPRTVIHLVVIIISLVSLIFSGCAVAMFIRCIPYAWDSHGWSFCTVI